MNTDIAFIVNRILAPDCPPVVNPVVNTGCGPCGGYPVPYVQQAPIWSGGYNYGTPYNAYGINQCLVQKLQQVLSMLNSTLSPLPREMQLNLLNTPVVSFVPGQGNTEITLLEAAIVMRWPALVEQLIVMGASPNVSTSGISLIAQLIEALPLDFQDGNAQNTQAIIDILQRSGSYVPPGYPGTQGYLPEYIRGERRRYY